MFRNHSKRQRKSGGDSSAPAANQKSFQRSDKRKRNWNKQQDIDVGTFSGPSKKGRMLRESYRMSPASQNLSTEQQKNKYNEHRRRGPPSEEALELSSQLKNLSRNKKWDEALQIYRDRSNDKIRDTHHACIMVDMAARCGNISEGEQIFRELEEQKKFISVELRTALLKGFAHSGKLDKAEALFHELCSSKGKANKPNVRTLNTLLRGCLWSAASVSWDGNSIVGGVVTAERAWEAYDNLKCDSAIFDVSSYEYLIALLCYALRTTDARKRIQEMEERFDLHDSESGVPASDDQSLTEALAVAHLALGRAHAILNEAKESIEECQKSVQFAQASRNALKSDTFFSRKRSWKESNEIDDRRSQSNAVFRDHRLSEIETEAKSIIDICSECIQDGALAARDLARRMTTRLVYLSGGGTSERCSTDKSGCGGDTSSKSAQRHLINSLFFSFGLSSVAKKLVASPMTNHASPLKQKDCNRVLGAVGLQGGIFNDDGTLNLHRIFSAGIGATKNQKKRRNKSQRVELELGAGFGDWIVRKAMENPSTNHMAVELRADRVAQIFARTAILSSSTPINNLCVIGGDSGRFLSNYLSPGSIDAVYINHPEPPTQTFGADSKALLSIMQGGNEPGHMLQSSVLIAAMNSLKESSKSKLIIVTDNKWYARLICATLHKVKKLHPGRLETVDLPKEDASFQKTEVAEIEGFEGQLLSAIFVGQPNESIGYTSSIGAKGNSYFDRLWRAGAGTHAERRDRFVLIERATDTRNVSISR
ncbi:PPR: pentatricopeptide repeat domain containing protein [Nitzschia inconspicua]|uniref:PPR: pentatricopeptide repeat domain containing protein n=1 Tax=Nitzschia inconspicua TaxID=303405 RepID=A0A9K3LG93_9STRA|nr:PPR: pentatricopeptide repeat domain containing protein [Nitzschia inconspicua]